MRILILGGYGRFGSRLAALWSDLPQLTLIIAGRDLAKAEAFCAGYTGAPHIQAAAFDRKDVAVHLPILQPDLVIDASGPFQTTDWAVVTASIAAKVAYLDFADASDFVCGITQFDDQAQAAGIPIISGLSTCPAITSAALNALADHMTIADVTGGIAPTPRAPLGGSVLRAVLGYAGSLVRLRRFGKDTTATGLAELRGLTVAPPGAMPLRRRYFALVDVPDLQLLPKAHPNLRSTWFGAGTAPQPLLLALNLMARLRRLLRLPNMARLAPLAETTLRHITYGPHRGGMIVQAKGTRDGQPATASWHLLAEGDVGPSVPCLPIDAVVRKWLAGDPPAPGARPALDCVTLADLEPGLERLGIVTGLRPPVACDAPLYARVLGPAFEQLPQVVQTLHRPGAQAQWCGTARVDGGETWPARVVARIVGFPSTVDTIPVTVTLTRKGGAELWQRDFNGQTFQSLQWPGQGRHDHLLMERFGPITVALAVTVRDDRLDLIPQCWSFLGVPLPRFLMPQGPCFETANGRDFCFDVTIRAPLIGRIVRYRGQLQAG